MKAKILKVISEGEARPTARGGQLRRWVADIEVDGAKKDAAEIKTFDDKVAPQPGVEFECKEDEYQGRISYMLSIVKKGFSGGGFGGRQRDPEHDKMVQRAIILQNSLSNAIQYMHGATGCEDCPKSADDILALVDKFFEHVWTRANGKERASRATPPPTQKNQLKTEEVKLGNVDEKDGCWFAKLDDVTYYTKEKAVGEQMILHAGDAIEVTYTAGQREGTREVRGVRTVG